MREEPDHDHLPASPGEEPTPLLSEPVEPASAPVYASSVMMHVDALAGQIGARPAGSAQEQQAAEYVLEQCAAQGVPAIGLPISAPVFASWPELISILGALIALLIALLQGLLGFGLALVVLLVYLTGALLHPAVAARLPSRRSVNVLAIAPARRAELRRLVISAALDSPCVGLLGDARLAPLQERLAPLVAAALTLAAVVTGIDLRTERAHFRLTFAVAALLLVALLALIGEREWRGTLSAGARTYASSLAALIEIATRLQAQPTDWVEVWLLGLGATRTEQAGMRQLLAENQFDPDVTLFVHLHSVGAGRLHYAIADGALRARHAAPTLARLAAAGEGAASALPLARLRAETPTSVAAGAGYQAITIVGIADDPFPPTLDDAPSEIDSRAIEAAVAAALSITQLVEAEMVERQRMAALARRGEPVSAVDAGT